MSEQPEEEAQEPEVAVAHPGVAGGGGVAPSAPDDSEEQSGD